MTVRRLSGVLVEGRELVFVSRAVDAVLDQQRRRDGIYPAPWLRELSEELRAASAACLARPGQRDVPVELSSAPFFVGEDWITTKEAATMMGISARTVRRRATDLGARRVGGRLLIDPVVVADFGRGDAA